MDFFIKIIGLHILIIKKMCYIDLRDINSFYFYNISLFFIKIIFKLNYSSKK